MSLYYSDPFEERRSDVRMQRCGFINYDGIFPEGTPCKVLNDIVDPFAPQDLKKGSVVHVVKIEYKTNNTWVVCQDQDGLFWNVRPRDLDPIKIDQNKKGRYRILAMENEIENSENRS